MMVAYSITPGSLQFLIKLIDKNHDKFLIMKKALSVFILIFVGIVVFRLAGRYLPFPINCAPSYNAKNVDLPDFVVTVWPDPGVEIKSYCFQQVGMGIEVSSLVLDIFETEKGCCSNMDSKATFFIDGTRISREKYLLEGHMAGIGFVHEDGTVTEVGPASYIFILKPKLSRGEHTAEIKIVNDIGKEFDFDWRFTIR